MKLPRDMDGLALAALLCRKYGYRQVHQVGSHVILETDHPAHQRLSIPAHKHLRMGTLNAILSAVARVQLVSKEDILK